MSRSENHVVPKVGVSWIDDDEDFVKSWVRHHAYLEAQRVETASSISEEKVSPEAPPSSPKSESSVTKFLLPATLSRPFRQPDCDAKGDVDCAHCLMPHNSEGIRGRRDLKCECMCHSRRPGYCYAKTLPSNSCDSNSKDHVKKAVGENKTVTVPTIASSSRSRASSTNNGKEITFHGDSIPLFQEPVMKPKHKTETPSIIKDLLSQSHTIQKKKRKAFETASSYSVVPMKKSKRPKKGFNETNISKNDVAKLVNALHPYSIVETDKHVVLYCTEDYLKNTSQVLLSSSHSSKTTSSCQRPRGKKPEKRSSGILGGFFNWIFKS